MSLTHRTAAVSLLLLALVPILPSAATSCRFRGIFNFGDSNSDTGGFWAAFPPLRPPFGMTFFKRPAGRCSDGRLFIDFLAQAIGLPFLSPYLQSIGSRFQHGANFATSASTVLMPSTSLFVTGTSPFFLGVQLSQMIEFSSRVLQAGSQDFNADNLPHKDIFGQALFTIDIGQNDFASNLANLPQLADQIGKTIMELYDIGGRTFFVFNLAPVGCFPSFLVEFPHDNSDLDEHGCMISYNKAVVDYNMLLNQTLHEVRNQLKDASVVYVDTHSVKLELYRNPKNHGFLYATRACCGYGGGDYNFDPRLFCSNSKVIDGRMVTATACSDPENYVSWDGVHATEAANKHLALAILNGSYFYPPFPLSELCDLQQIS